MQESISRDELMRELGDKLNADPGLVSRRVRSSKPEPAPRESPRPTTVPGNGAAVPAAGEGRAPTQHRGRPREPHSVGPRERRERALLAMCIAEPSKGRAYIERLTPAHLSTDANRKALAWLEGHLETPLAGLPREDEQLSAAITHLVMRAESEPASTDALELNFLELEQGLIEDQIAAASGGEDPPVALHRQRAELAERIAHFGTPGSEEA